MSGHEIGRPVKQILDVDDSQLSGKLGQGLAAGLRHQHGLTQADPVAAGNPHGDGQMKQHARRQHADAGIECIGCGVCYGACDVVAVKPNYLGPAALNRAWTLVNDARDAMGGKRLSLVAGDDGCLGCHSQQGCQAHCPKSLNPTLAIAGLKRAVAAAALKGKL